MTLEQVLRSNYPLPNIRNLPDVITQEDIQYFNRSGVSMLGSATQAGHTDKVNRLLEIADYLDKYHDPLNLVHYTEKMIAYSSFYAFYKSENIQNIKNIWASALKIGTAFATDMILNNSCAAFRECLADEESDTFLAFWECATSLGMDVQLKVLELIKDNDVSETIHKLVDDLRVPVIKEVFFKACSDGDLKKIQELIMEDSWLLAERNFSGMSPLHVSLLYPETVQYLLEQNPTLLKVTDSRGLTALEVIEKNPSVQSILCYNGIGGRAKRTEYIKEHFENKYMAAQEFEETCQILHGLDSGFAEE